MRIKSKAFDIAERGFSVRAYYLEAPDAGDALVEMFKDGEPLRSFMYPAYRVWNIAAHFGDMVDNELSPTPDAGEGR